MSSMKVNVKSEILKILRQTSGYSVEDIAKKLRVSNKKVERTECGREKYTLVQIKKLAKIYKRPLVAFFSSTIPELPEIHIYFEKLEK